jgi:UDP-glucose 6-dehydrogenase
MDTDELSNEAYEGIIITAEKFHHDLTLQFGVLASSCKNETDDLSKAKQLIKRIERLHRSNLSNIFFDTIPSKKDLDATLEKILINISAVESIPESERHFDF